MESSIEESKERVVDILKSAYERTHPASMLSEERKALLGSKGALIAELKKIVKEFKKEGEPDLMDIAERIVDWENPSEKDQLFLFRLCAPGLRAIQASVLSAH